MNVERTRASGVPESALHFRIRIPKVGEVGEAPKTCLHCQSARIHRHQKCERDIVDLEKVKTRADRYSCVDCGRTFRTYADGVSRARQSEPIIVLSILLYALGLGYGHISRVFEMLGYYVSRTSVFRNVEAAGPRVRHLHESKQQRPVRVIGNHRQLGRAGRSGVALNLMITATAQELEMTASDTAEEIAFMDGFLSVARELGCLVTD